MENNLSKVSFFTALEQLDNLKDSSEEEDPLERVIASSRPFQIQTRTATLEPSPPESVPLLRANSDPQPSPANKEPSEVIVVDEESPRRNVSLDERKVRTIQRSQTTGAMPGFKTGGPPPSKKRRMNSIKTVPEGQQIFTELVFCWLLGVCLQNDI